MCIVVCIVVRVLTIVICTCSPFLFTEKNSSSDCFVTDHFVSEKSSFHAMESDLMNSRVVTACSDRKIRIYDIVSGKEMKAVKGNR